jgi:GMP synthase-like glutamine amidotransferase
MIAYVDMEHERALRTSEQRASHRAFVEGVHGRLAAIAGTPCRVRRYTEASEAWLREIDARALVIGGNVTNWPHYSGDSLAPMFGIIREAAIPILGLCGGHQLIALAHGGPEAINPLRAGDPAPDAIYGPDSFREWGFTPVRILRPDPLFDGLPETPVFLEAHYLEVAGPPPGFDALASTGDCRVQVMKRADRPVYGAQFHPEGYIDGPGDALAWLVGYVYHDGYDRRQPDGRRLLSNFFRLAGLLG